MSNFIDDIIDAAGQILGGMFGVDAPEYMPPTEDDLEQVRERERRLQGMVK